MENLYWSWQEHVKANECRGFLCHEKHSGLRKEQQHLLHLIDKRAALLLVVKNINYTNIDLIFYYVCCFF